MVTYVCLTPNSPRIYADGFVPKSEVTNLFVTLPSFFFFSFFVLAAFPMGVGVDGTGSFCYPLFAMVKAEREIPRDREWREIANGKNHTQ